MKKLKYKPGQPQQLQRVLAKHLPKKPTKEQAEAAIRTLIAFIGDNPDREGLLRTPERVIKAWSRDWGLGYNNSYVTKQIRSILKGRFGDGAQSHSQMIAVKKIHFFSHCEHHLAPFQGTVDVAYIPSEGGPILGLSKLVRIVELFSQKLQVQERLTDEVADFLDKHCKPLGVGVICRATHGCMTSRGVKQHDPVAVTSALRGEMLKRPEVRDEFFRLVERRDG
jgi:GTP cyclohydrolase I